MERVPEIAAPILCTKGPPASDWALGHAILPFPNHNLLAKGRGAVNLIFPSSAWKVSSLRKVRWVWCRPGLEVEGAAIRSFLDFAGQRQGQPCRSGLVSVGGGGPLTLRKFLTNRETEISILTSPNCYSECSLSALCELDVLWRWLSRFALNRVE